MVDLSSGSDGFIEQSINNVVFIIPAVIVISLVVFFVYKLFKCLQERERKREEKKKNKQLRKKK